MCKEALGRYVDTELEKPIEYHQALKGVKCPACTNTFTGERLLELLSPEMREKYADLQSKCAEKEKHEEEVAAQKPEDVEVLRQSIRLQFTDGKGRLKGKMCPTCKFGPIEHFACDDLRAHHNQKIAEDVRISNACPVCHYFHSNIRKWNEWDGSFLDQDRVDEIERVKKDHVLEFETCKKKLEAAYKKYEEDSVLVEKLFQKSVTLYKEKLEAFKNYYPSHGVREPALVRREMSAAKGEKKLELAREFRKSFRLWKKEPKEPEYPSGSAEEWLKEKKRKLVERRKEAETKMRNSIELDVKNLVKADEEEVAAI